ncbi:hypothetical protein [Vibrio sp. 10N.222.55.C7]|uniref:hypothetical protein n=1 Tax=Vibrio sp. 10N.222.55.C7 TaxID=3229650 RepID=UPI00354BEA87
MENKEMRLRIKDHDVKKEIALLAEEWNCSNTQAVMNLVAISISNRLKAESSH